MTILPRAATAPELAKLRSENQSSRLYLTVQMPAQVYVARVAATPSSTDNVASISYNSGSGTYTDVLTDMTMYVSATGYGNYDKGMCRVRGVGSMGAATGSIDVFTSEINWAANDYLTIVDAFDLWPRTPYGDNMDYSIAYTDQHSKCASIPVLGGRYKVKWLTGATVSVYPDASSSWALNNTITGIQWAAPGSSASSGMTTNTPTITYNAANFDAGYRTSLTLTNSDGVTSVGYGRVFVLASENDAITQFRVDSIQGSYQSGGWSAQVTMYGQADLTVIRDRALCIIHRRDWYGNTEGSIGYVADDENIEMVGWIAGDTIKWSPLWSGAGAVTFTIQGPQYWLNKLTMPAVGLKNISSHAPTNWKRFTGLTAKSATWHILYWRTTAPACIDCFPIDNAWGALQLQGSGASTVWQQITTILSDFLIAKPCCDSLGRLFMQIEQNCLPAATRSSIPTVMTVTTGDWWNAIDFERREVQDVAAVDLSGDIYNGTTSTPTFSLSPGRTFGARGSSVFVRDRLVLYDQSSANALAGAVYGWQNNPYPRWRFQLASNMHLIDIAPYQYLSVDVIPADTRRGFAATGLRLIPRTITRTFQNGVLLSEVDVEAESSIGLGITGDTPAAPPSGSGTGTPPPAPLPNPVPLPSGDAREIWFAVASGGFTSQRRVVWSGDVMGGGQPTWNPVALPVSGDPFGFGAAQDGAHIYLGVGSSIYDLTNVAAIRAAPATAPTWTPILTIGDTITASPGGSIVVSHIDQMRMHQNFLTIRGRGAGGTKRLYGVYNGTSWSFKNPANNYTDGLLGVTYQYLVRIGFIGPNVFECPMNDAGTDYEIVAYVANSIGGNYLWHNPVNGSLYFSYGKLISGSDVQFMLRTDPGASDVAALSTQSSGGHVGPALADIRGAWNGVSVWVVDALTGRLYIAPDGSTFSNPPNAIWLTGIRHIVMNTSTAGGPGYFWMPQATTNSNTILRISADSFVTAPVDRTGNYWTTIDTSGGTFNLVDMWAVY